MRNPVVPGGMRRIPGSRRAGAALPLRQCPLPASPRSAAGGSRLAGGTRRSQEGSRGTHLEAISRSWLSSVWFSLKVLVKSGNVSSFLSKCAD